MKIHGLGLLVVVMLVAGAAGSLGGAGGVLVPGVGGVAEVSGDGGVGVGLVSAIGPPGEAASAFRAEWPVAEPHVLLRAFAAPPTAFAAGHRGIDIAADPDEQVVAPAAGVVTYAAVVVDRPVVSIDHGNGFVSSLEPVTAVVSLGQTVVAGQPIGSVAVWSHCAVSCIHYGVRLDGQYVSPMLVLASVPRAVLLPFGGG
ncbi:M23 family metallopeptidase [Subtercola sp. RTI3]|uniref:murein hydrolase activator EnvC family protein n=1 Tax=Subtercola sp. RTI3 TaxID=3048639 RepID=UPI002B222F1F|nr:M23 family metallopeptidase [Subtercola sp. RTI3]MEA9986278.1 M23 family metallopeptidase [Subtercola sp. RTI3]